MVTYSNKPTDHPDIYPIPPKGLYLKQKLTAYTQLIRLHRPTGILLLLWPTLWALWIAGAGRPKPLLVVIFVTGVFLMRSAGCVINDIADRNFDGKVERTKTRPLVTGRVSVREALLLFIGLSFAAFLLLWPLNMFARLLAIPAMLLAVSYPFAKRYTHFPQLIMGLAFSWGIPMVFAAQTGAVPTYAWLLFLTASLWPVAYDTIYAMMDKEDDKVAGIKSMAVILGHWSTGLVAVLHANILLLLLAMGFYLEMGFAYYLGLLGAAAVMTYLQSLIRQDNTRSFFKAFQKSHWVGCMIFAGIVLSYL
jgi:4-hydroxybenzoate polyprenyltransferase